MLTITYYPCGSVCDVRNLHVFPEKSSEIQGLCGGDTWVFPGGSLRSCDRGENHTPLTVHIGAVADLLHQYIARLHAHRVASGQHATILEVSYPSEPRHVLRRHNPGHLSGSPGRSRPIPSPSQTYIFSGCKKARLRAPTQFYIVLC